MRQTFAGQADSARNVESRESLPTGVLPARRGRSSGLANAAGRPNDCALDSALAGRRYHRRAPSSASSGSLEVQL